MADGRALMLKVWDSSALVEFSQQMAEAESRGQAFKLDLSDSSIVGVDIRPEAVRLDIPTVLVVANLLLGRFRDLPIEVVLPQARGLNLQLARGGLFFALANRESVAFSDCAPPAWETLSSAWSLPFHPTDQDMFHDALVAHHDVDRDSWLIRAAFQRYLLSVVHPHRRPAGSLREELQRISRRWLSTRLSVRAGSDLVATLLDCTEIFYELVVNVPDHAAVATSTGASLGQLYATLGGGSDSHNRLHFSALDNGVGIPRRVGHLYRDRDRTAEEALSDALTGRLPPRPGRRGRGLFGVRNIAEQYANGERAVGGRGTIRVVTSGDQPGSAAALTWRTDKGEPRTESITELPLEGTIICLSLGLQRAIEPTDAADQLELEFIEPLARSTA